MKTRNKLLPEPTRNVLFVLFSRSELPLKATGTEGKWKFGSLVLSMYFQAAFYLFPGDCRDISRVK